MNTKVFLESCNLPLPTSLLEVYLNTGGKKVQLHNTQYLFNSVLPLKFWSFVLSPLHLSVD